jgi:hypothetical protein
MRKPMDIFEYMTCEGCKHVAYLAGVYASDPYYSYDSECVCRIGAPDEGPCAEMLEAIEDSFVDGCFETDIGAVYTREHLLTQAGRGMLNEYGLSAVTEQLMSNKAKYWWLPISDTGGKIADREPEPYKNLKVLFKVWFT